MMTEYEKPQRPDADPMSGQPAPTASVGSGQGAKQESRSNIISTVAVLLIAPLVALLLTSFVFQSYQVDGPSMQTTLFNNDRLLVWKMPRTWARITHHQYVPQRGDVVIFVERGLSDFADNGSGKQLIKRVIALPGERVVVKDNEVTVYNKQHPDGFSPDKTQPYGKVITDTTNNIDLTVPKGKIFVMGDNRPDSLDSRSFGPVDLNDVVGKLVMRVWPINQAKTF
jgi:signal peptidase I